MYPADPDSAGRSGFRTADRGSEGAKDRRGQADVRLTGRR